MELEVFIPRTKIKKVTFTLLFVRHFRRKYNENMEGVLSFAERYAHLCSRWKAYNLVSFNYLIDTSFISTLILKIDSAEVRYDDGYRKRDD